MKSNVAGWLAAGATVVGVTLWAGLSISQPEGPSAAPSAASAPRRAAQQLASREEHRQIADPIDGQAAPIPEPTDETDEVADFTQSDPELAAPADGGSYCGPVAVSNWLVWLADHGYPKLTPPGPNRRARQIALIRELARHRYMATDPKMGTGSWRLIEGLERWVRDAGYSIKLLKYQGWRGHAPRHGTGQRHPELAWLAAALADGGAAWIHVGWYEPPTRWERALRRKGGHWLTVVGVNEHLRELTLHDPAPYAGTEPEKVHATTRAMTGGWLLAGKDRLPAAGYLRLGGGMHLKRNDDVAVIDGAVVLVLDAPQP